MTDQPTSTDRVALFDYDDAKALREAGRILRRVRDAATTAAWNAPSAPGLDGATAQDYGRLAGLADLADDVLFDVVNVADNYCGDRIAGRVAERWHRG